MSEDKGPDQLRMVLIEMLDASNKVGDALRGRLPPEEVLRRCLRFDVTSDLANRLWEHEKARKAEEEKKQ